MISEKLTSLFLLERIFQILNCYSVEEVSPEILMECLSGLDPEILAEFEAGEML